MTDIQASGASEFPLMTPDEQTEYERDVAAYQKQADDLVRHLRQDARAVMKASSGWRAVRTNAAWETMCADARRDFIDGSFLIAQLGAERLLDPRLIAVLWQLRQSLLAELGTVSPSEM